MFFSHRIYDQNEVDTSLQSIVEEKTHETCNNMLRASKMEVTLKRTKSIAEWTEEVILHVNKQTMEDHLTSERNV